MNNYNSDNNNNLNGQNPYNNPYGPNGQGSYNNGPYSNSFNNGFAPIPNQIPESFVKDYKKIRILAIFQIIVSIISILIFIIGGIMYGLRIWQQTIIFVGVAVYIGSILLIKPLAQTVQIHKNDHFPEKNYWSEVFTFLFSRCFYFYISLSSWLYGC